MPGIRETASRDAADITEPENANFHVPSCGPSASTELFPNSISSSRWHCSHINVSSVARFSDETDQYSFKLLRHNGPVVTCRRLACQILHPRAMAAVAEQFGHTRGKLRSGVCEQYVASVLHIQSLRSDAG